MAELSLVEPKPYTYHRSYRWHWYWLDNEHETLCGRRINPARWLYHIAHSVWRPLQEEFCQRCWELH